LIISGEVVTKLAKVAWSVSGLLISGEVVTKMSKSRMVRFRFAHFGIGGDKNEQKSHAGQAQHILQTLQILN
jgi:hypothetical protein